VAKNVELRKVKLEIHLTEVAKEKEGESEKIKKN